MGGRYIDYSVLEKTKSTTGSAKNYASFMVSVGHGDRTN